MKKLFIPFILFIVVSTYSQVGIGTNNPQEELHIAGSNSTIRIDGLNATNNPNNNGNGNSTRVFVDAEGDLVLGNSGDNISVLFDPEDYLDSNEGNNSTFTQNGTGSGYQSVGVPAAFGEGLSQFTLDRNAILELNYAVSWRLRKNDNFTLDDGAARIVQTYVRLYKWDLLGNAVGFVTSDLDGQPVVFLGLNGQYYSNQLQSNGAERLFINNGTDYIKLGPGIYRPIFYAQVAVSNTNGVGAIKFYIGGGQDEMQVVAHYYN